MCVVDEPVGSINPVVASRIFELIRRMRDDFGMTFLIVEHQLDIAMPHADYVCAIADGKVLCDGCPDSVLGNKELQDTYLSLSWQNIQN